MAVCAEWNEVVGKAPIPRVAVAVLVCRNERVLMCRRKSKTSYDDYALPGGFLQFGETLEECAIREVAEESGIEIQNVKLGTVTNTILLDNDMRPAHYLTVYVKATPAYHDSEPETLEADKCDGWTWADWPEVPRPLFKPVEELLETEYDPFL